jgi:hypothetical protein
MAENQRKRARTHDGPEGEVEPDPVRDPDYYFDDGDFVIRAQNTLFRVGARVVVTRFLNAHIHSGA